MSDKFTETPFTKQFKKDAAALRRPKICEECGVNPGDPRICPGCQAYREHTGHF